MFKAGVESIFTAEKKLKSRMESPVVFVLFLATITFTGEVHSQMIYASENPLPVGSNVTLFSNVSVTTGIWLFDNDMIVLILPSNGSIISNTWSSRVTFNHTTASLTIRSLREEDSGVYTLQSVNAFRAQLTLSVQVPISNVTLSAKATNLVEFNDTAVLTCSVSKGSSLSYKWLKGNSMITAGGAIQFSNGGSTLTIDSVTHSDEGPFRCNVSNGVSSAISPAVHLNISYGPSNATITAMPMENMYRTGSNITLTCSAGSKPPASIQWMVDGVNLNQSGSQLQLTNVKESNSGNYKCLLHNSVTSRFSSVSKMIRVLDPLTSVVVNQTSGPAILNKSFTLHCDVNGTVDSIQWMKNGHLISADNTTSFGTGNKSLTLNPVKHSDNGDYQCQAFNSVSNMTSSSYTVDVNYGPETPTIMGPNVAKTGNNVTLYCNASSKPPSNYKWYFNGSVVSNMSAYVTPPLTTGMSGKYTCVAFNKVTGKNSTASTMLTVVDPITNVQVEASMHPAKEGYSYNLTCNVTGPADHIYWMKNGQTLHEDNSTAFHMGNRTVTFSPVNRYDSGYYQCMAINAVGNMTSPKYKLTVYFGPDTPVIYGPAFAETGRYAVFNCSAMSMPPSHFTWWHNGTMVANTSVFTAGPLSFNMSGEYTCVAYNSATGKNRTSSKVLTVIEAIQSVTVRNSSVPINNDNLTLTCDVVGPYDSIHWMEDNMTLSNNTSNTNMSYQVDKNMLHFTPVTTHNDGKYQCVATNRAGQHKSPQYMLLVNYGPLNVSISGPDSAQMGVSVNLMCSADSRPESNFYWYLNNHSMPLKNGSVITFTASKQNEGKYMCQATNPVTNITMLQYKMFAVAASAFHLPSQTGLMLMGLFALSAPMLFN